MALFSVKDLVNAIPTYNGDERQLETFINVCSKYFSLIENNQKDQFVIIIQTKIVGEALADLQPIDDLKTWEDIKSKLEEKLKIPDTYEFAQEELSTIRQRKNENMEEYGKRIRKGLEKLNLATKSLTQLDTVLTPLRKANEIHAIRKFEQNMFNEKIKLMVGAANFDSLQDAVKFAMNKELFQKTTNNKTCNFCKNIGHVEEECRKKAKQSDVKKDEKQSLNSPQTSYPSHFRRNSYYFQNNGKMGNGQKYYGQGNRDDNNTYYARNKNFPNHPINYQNANSGNNQGPQATSGDANRHETSRIQNNEQQKHNMQNVSSNPRYERNTQRNMRTIHEINSQLEPVAITEEQDQLQTLANKSKN